MQNCAQKCQQIWQNIQQVLVKICEKVVKHVENIQVDLYEIQRVTFLTLWEMCYLAVLWCMVTISARDVTKPQNDKLNDELI